jgi:hypothetical protein
MTRTQRVKYNLIIQYTKDQHVDTYLKTLYTNQYADLSFHTEYAHVRISDDLMELIATERVSMGSTVDLTVNDLIEIFEDDYDEAILLGKSDPAGIRTELGKLIISRKG